MAIELAAARTRLLSVENLQARIEDLRRGQVSDRDSHGRDSLSLTWAINLLSDESRETFAHLSVFPGTFTVDAAQAVGGAGLDDLAALADAGLVRPAEGTGRFDVHPALRALGTDRLVGEQCSDLANRHAAYYTNVAAEAAHAEALAGSPADVLADEHNIRAALAWGLERSRRRPAARSRRRDRPALA